MQHGFPFDPTYGFDLERLLALPPPPPPDGFADFWRDRHDRAVRVDPEAHLGECPWKRPGFHVQDLLYHSTQGVPIHGWVLVPENVEPVYGLILGHGYGGIERPDYALPRNDIVYFIPCFRGLARSRLPNVSDNPSIHVLHGIDELEHYILGGCVEDIWVAVSAFTELFPALAGRIGYAGISFGGGIGAMALAWEPRIARGHLNVPTFGHQLARLNWPTAGSGAAVQAHVPQNRRALDTLPYYDAAVAAQFIQQPMHFANALFDPCVAPPGQFAVYNAVTARKRLFVLEAGHFDYPRRTAQEHDLLGELAQFFGGDEARIPQLA